MNERNKSITLPVSLQGSSLQRPPVLTLDRTAAVALEKSSFVKPSYVPLVTLVRPATVTFVRPATITLERIPTTRVEFKKRCFSLDFSPSQNEVQMNKRSDLLSSWQQI